MNELDAVAAFAYESGHLARTARAGWLLPGVREPESVAEHSHRTAILAFVIAHEEGANADRAATLAVFHDLPETRSTDRHSVAKRYTTAADPQQIIADQTTELPTELAHRIRAAIAEVEAKETPESICARDADKLDCLLRAREYQAAGYQLMQPWVDTMVAAVRTRTGKELAERAQRVSPGSWWHHVASAYGPQTSAE